jgi:lipooligosaccharide transport system permease protein
MIHPAVASFEHHVLTYRRTWKGTVFSAFLLPALFLVAMGKSVGGYVDARAGMGVPYLDYIAPGLLATTAIQVGVVEGAFVVFSGFQWSRTYHAMRASALRPWDILAGHLAFALMRVAMSAAGFVVVMAALGTVRSPAGLPLALPAAIVTGFSLTPLVFAYSAVISSDGMFAILFRFVLVPMSLFAGVFFPVTAMPPAARPVAYALPLWHGVELCRAATLGTATAWGAPAHLGILALWITVGVLAARHLFARQLTD